MESVGEEEAKNVNQSELKEATERKRRQKGIPFKGTNVMFGHKVIVRVN